MDIKNKIKEYFPYIITTLAIILPWFFDSGFLFFIDMVRGPNISLDWTNNNFLVNLIIKSLSVIFSTAFLQKVYIGFAIFIVLLGGRKITSFFIKDKFAIFILSLFALFNPFVYDRMMYGQAGIVLALGFLLFAFSCLLNYLDTRESKQIIYFGVFTGLALPISPHFIFFFSVIFLLFLFLYFNKWKLDGWKNFIKYTFGAFVLCLLLNINWITADLLGKTNKINFVNSLITEQDLNAFQTVGDTDIQVLNNVIRMSGFWAKDQNRYVDLGDIKTFFGGSFLFLSFVILFGFIVGVSKKENRLLSLGLLFIFSISVVLASGVGVSFIKDFTYWLFENIPLYKGLRETQKWVAVIVLVYLVFLSIGAKALFETEIFIKYRKILLSLFGIVVVMQAPLLLWGFFGQVRVIQYPSDWQIVNNELKCKKGEKILFLPWHLYMKFNWVGKVVGNPAPVFFTCPVISSTAMEWGGIYDNSGNADSLKIQEWLSVKGKNNLLKDNILGIRYIVLAKEVDWRNYLWMDKISEIETIKETITLKVYKIK